MNDKKKVLIFVPKFPVATETFIQREIVALAKLGSLDVTVLAIEQGNTKYDIALKNKVFIRSASLIDIFFSPIFVLIGCIFNNSAYMKVWSAFNESNISFISRINLLIKSVGFYARIFKKFKPDFIYTHFLSEPSSVAMGAALYLNVPFAISAHAKDILVTGQLIKSKVINAKFINICNLNAWEFCREKATASKEDHQEVIDLSKIQLRYHGINFDNIGNTAAKENTIPVILNNSRLTAKKGQIYLLQAAKILKDENRKFIIKIIAGGGDLYEELTQFISENSLQEYVNIINDGNPIFYDEVEKYYRNSDMFVFPSIETSLGDADGVANVLIEAASHHLPIIATDAGSANELVENRITGVVVPQRDAIALADAIKYVLDNPLVAQSMAEKAYELVREKFDLANNVKLIEKDILENTK
jgi:glycosyltransferase involved in cell wall biosynthesis